MALATVQRDRQDLVDMESESMEDANAGVELLAAETAESLVVLFKLLSDETRLQILRILQQRREVNVLTLCRLLQLRQPSVSHHLALLRSNQLIEMRREGKHNYYRLIPQRFEQLMELFFRSSGLPGGTPASAGV